MTAQMHLFAEASTVESTDPREVVFAEACALISRGASVSAALDALLVFDTAISPGEILDLVMRADRRGRRAPR